MKFVYCDGGRNEAGFTLKAGDCVVRAIAIASSQAYVTVRHEIQILASQEKLPVKNGFTRGRSSAEHGVFKSTYKHYIENILGWKWTPTMSRGSGCKVHLTENELPSGRLIIRVSKHLVAVINGVIYDTSDPSRGGTRCVYGYWSKPNG